MQANILWTGREYYSLENCLVHTSASGFEIRSTIIGMYEQQLYHVEYFIVTNENWETISVELKSRLDYISGTTHLERDAHGNWKLNGENAAQFIGCADVDIPLTPFTNTLPINRLKLRIGETEEIRVVYLDVLAQTIKVVHQKYIRLSETEYQYENIPNDFEAKIQVDASGFVVDYPALFVRTALK